MTPLHPALLIARREWSEHLHGVRFVVLCAMAVVLLPLSVIVNARGVAVRRQHAEALAHERDAKRASGAHALLPIRHARSVSDPALRIVRQPSNLSILAIGWDAAEPVFRQAGEDGLTDGPVSDASPRTNGLAGDVDLALVVQIVLGLLAILLASDAICGEKERGTLRVLLSHPVPRSAFIAGKLLGGLGPLLAVLLVSMPVAVVTAWLVHAPLVSSSAMPRLLLFLAGAALYLCALHAIGLAVSATTHRQRTSLVIVLVLWVAFVFIIPRTARLVAELAHPAVPQAVVWQRITDGLAAIEDERRHALSNVLVLKPGETLDVIASDEARLDAYAAASESVDVAAIARRRALIARWNGEREESIARQRRTERLIGMLSPASAFGVLAAEVAGTGESMRMAARRDAEAYQRQLEAALFDRRWSIDFYTYSTRNNEGEVVKQGEAHATRGGRKSLPPVYEALPDARVSPPSASASFAAALPMFSALALAASLGIALTAWLFARYDMR